MNVMLTKLELKNKAIRLRKNGLSYSSISKIIIVPKSTLSDWLKNISLTIEQRNNLSKKIKQGQIQGAKASRDKRVLISNQIKSYAINEIRKIDKKEMLMLGVMLYWGEGSKQSDRNISQPVEFVNSNPKMCKFFIKWITKIIGVSVNDLVFRVYINESKKNRCNEYINIWSDIINISSERIKVSFTKDRHSNLKRIGKDEYKGQLRIVVKRSTNLNRRIAGLIDGICLQSGVM